MKPQLTAELTAEECRGCHTPEEIENPGFTEARRFAGTADRRRQVRRYLVLSHARISR